MRILKLTYLSASLIVLSTLIDPGYAVKGFKEFKKSSYISKKYISTSFKVDELKNTTKKLTNIHQKKDFSSFIKSKSKKMKEDNFIQKVTYSSDNKKIPLFKENLFSSKNEPELLYNKARNQWHYYVESNNTLRIVEEGRPISKTEISQQIVTHRIKKEKEQILSDLTSYKMPVYEKKKN